MELVLIISYSLNRNGWNWWRCFYLQLGGQWPRVDRVQHGVDKKPCALLEFDFLRAARLLHL